MDLLFSIAGATIFYVVMVAVFSLIYKGMFEDRFIALYSVFWPISGAIVLFSLIIMEIEDKIFKR